VEVTFLLGAGISARVVGLSTVQLTEQVLADREPRLGPDTTSERPRNRWLDEADDDEAQRRLLVERIPGYLRCLRDEIAQCGQLDEIEISYEDVHHAAAVVRDELLYHAGNPVAKPFIDGALKRCPMSPDACSLHWDLVREAPHYIRHTVGQLLAPRQFSTYDLDYLHMFSQAYEDDQVERIRVFTLNHDQVLETYCRQRGLVFFDGFTPDKEGLERLEPSSFETAPDRMHVVKLHGSTDWFLRNGGAGAVPREVVVKSQPDGPRDAGSLSRSAYFNAPEILVGTFNKPLEYLSEHFAGLAFRLAAWLRRASHIVVCGHSFRDVGVKACLADFANPSLQRRNVVVIDPQVEALERRPDIPPVLRQRWLPMAHGIEVTDWPSLKNALLHGRRWRMKQREGPPIAQRESGSDT